MLILTRKVGERVVIAEGAIKIELTHIGHDDSVNLSVDNEGVQTELHLAELQEHAITDEISVKLLGNRGPKVARLGFNAPRDIPIHRQEVADDIAKVGQHNAAI